MANARKILIVDDDTDLRDTLVEQLSLHDEFEASAVDTGAKGATAAKTDAPDLVLMDVHMPEMGGFQATSEIRRSQVGAGLPIVALTARAMTGDREQCLAAGMDDYITKPVRREELERILQRWLKPKALVSPSESAP